MSPIDDELRTALHRRATAVPPSPDPLAGIERRAGRMRRNRIAASVAGSVLAVAAVATGVPLLLTPTVPDAPPVALTPPTAVPTAAPTAVVPTTSYALDPRAPWEYRGTPLDELGQGFLATARREYATKRGVAEDAVVLTPLWGQVDEPSARSELVFVASVDGADRWGLVQAGESGPEFPVDEPLPDPAVALAAALPGDEVARLVVVAAPTVGGLDHGPHDAAEYAPMVQPAPGVGTTPLEGDPATASFRVLDASGTVLLRQDVPEVATVPGQEAEGPGTDETPVVDASAYAFDPAQPWDFRGQSDVGGLAVEDERLFLAAGAAREGLAWSQRPLYAAVSDAGVSVLLVLHTADGVDPVVTTTWQRGDRAAEQVEQSVEEGQPLLQALVPTDLDDGSALLVALASPRAGGIVLDQDGRTRPDGIGDPGVGLWVLDEGERDGVVRLYTEGDGVEYAAVPVDAGAP